jgi:hypothetical protein
MRMGELTNAEMCEILSDCARRGSPSIAVQAVRMLLSLREEAEPEGALDEPIAALNELDVARRRARGRPQPRAS